MDYLSGILYREFGNQSLFMILRYHFLVNQRFDPFVRWIALQMGCYQKLHKYFFDQIEIEEDERITLLLLRN